MTGRRLYDIYCDETNRTPHHWGLSVLPHQGSKPVAWPFLSARDRRVWNAMAARLKGVKR